MDNTHGNWSPFRGRQGESQVLALRMEPGEPSSAYDRYYAYFFASDTQEWMLYGVSDTYLNNDNRRNTPPAERSIRIGSFTEVVGGARRERSGIYPRTNRYRGWILDANGQWHPLDEMSRAKPHDKTGLTTPQRRGVTEDGWFYNQTGGWKWYRPREEGGDGQLRIENPASLSDVPYLSEEHLDVLMSVPSEVTVEQVERRGNNVHVRYNVRGAGQDATVTAYWGTEDARALGDRWENTRLLDDDVDEDAHEAVILDVFPNKPFYLRLFLENDKGRFYAFETASLP